MRTRISPNTDTFYVVSSSKNCYRGFKIVFLVQKFKLTEKKLPVDIFPAEPANLNCFQIHLENPLQGVYYTMIFDSFSTK